MTEDLIKYLDRCEALIEDLEAANTAKGSSRVGLTILKLLEINRVLLDCVERNQHPHIEQFCKDRCRDALKTCNELVEK
jgi:hypothetical protein